MSMSIPRGFNELYSELTETRARYDALRIRNGSLRARADARQRLHELRFQLATLREGR